MLYYNGCSDTPRMKEEYVLLLETEGAISWHILLQR